MSKPEYQQKMFQEMAEKSIFEQARSYAYEYIDAIPDMQVFPSAENIKNLQAFDEPLNEKRSTGMEVLEMLNKWGSPATIAQIGGRYFGFVNGGAVPASLGVKWLADVWDQCGGLYLTSPINSKLEQVCEKWMVELLGLPEATVAGFVSGTSMANLCGLAAARFRILKNAGWDVNTSGLYGAPPVRIVAHEQIHASIKKTLSMLGFGIQNVEWVPSDNQGRAIAEKIPELDSSCLLILQAGNVNTGAFDDFDHICDMANEAGAWVHIDGAFGLWAAASKSRSHLTSGIEKASSWSVDGHKTLNTPYDSGIVMCKDEEALVSAMQASGEYIIYSDHKDPLLYTPEMSKRSRAIELWATMKYLGKQGIDDMVTGFHLRARQLEAGLANLDLELLNEVVFNQVLVRARNETITKALVTAIQESGECWLAGTTWNGKAAIRISVCSWATTESDIERTLHLIKSCLAGVTA
ncbi:MAG: pyridoxal-dependent decarboxylase [Bacteroidota bacterium]